MRVTDLPSWMWLPLKDNCEWDSPFNMGNCFDEQYHNVFFFLIKTLIYLTRFTTVPFVLFVAGMHGECMANLPMAVLSTITIIPMILLRLIWTEDYHTYGGMGNLMVAYSVKTWVILSMPNIVSWAPSAAFAVGQLVRIVRETIVSLRIQAYSSFDAEALFPTPFAGRDWDSDLSTSGAEAWMKKLVQEDQDRRRTRREEEERVAAEQTRLEQAFLLAQKLEDDTNNAIWKAISRKRPQPILRRQPALTHRQETELVAEERGLTKTQFLAQRYVVLLVGKSTQTDPIDFAVRRATKTPVSPIAKSYVSQGVQSDLAESPVRTQVKPSEPAPTGSSPSPPPPSTHETTPKKPASTPTTTTTITTTTPGRETPPVREPAPSAVSPRQEVVKPTTLPSLPFPGVGVVSSSQVVDEPIFCSKEELPRQVTVPFSEPTGLEPTQQLPSPEQVVGSDASLAQELPEIPDLPEELLFTGASGSEDDWEESLHQRLLQPTPCLSPAWNPYAPTALDAALDALITSGDEAEGHQDCDEMAIDDQCPVEDEEMEGQDESEVEVLTSSQAVDSVMEEAPIFHLEVFPPAQTFSPGHAMSEQEQEDLEMELEAAFDTMMEDAMGDDDELQAKALQQSQMEDTQYTAPWSLIRLNELLRAAVEEEIEVTHPPLDTRRNTSEDQEVARSSDLARAATKEQMERRKVLKPRLRAAGKAPTTPAPSTSIQQASSQPTPAPTPAPSTPASPMPAPPTPAPPITIRREPHQQKSPSSVVSKITDTIDTKKRQQTVAPIMMGGLMLPGGNQIIINTKVPAPIPAAAPTPTITPEQEAAFEKKRQAQIKAQQEARRNKKPSLFHQSKKPVTPGHRDLSTPRQQGTPSQSNTPSSAPQIKDSSVRTAAEAISGAPGSGQKKDGPKILASIPSHLRDQVAGKMAENEDEDESQIVRTHDR